VAAGPAGRVPDIAGPQVLDFADVLREYLRATGRGRRRVVEIRMPGTASARAGGMLPGPGAVTGGRSWARFVAEHHGAPARD
jgi:uncharacterized protein YbjT (DUF2867 family)